MNLIKLAIAGVLLVMAGYFFYPIGIGILHSMLGGMFTTIHNQIAMYTVLMSQAIATIIFLILGIWFLKKGINRKTINKI